MNTMLSHATVEELWEMVDVASLSADDSEKSAELLKRLMTELETRGELSQASNDEKKICYEGVLEKTSKFNNQQSMEIKLTSEKNRRRRFVRRIAVSAASLIVVFAMANVATAAAGFEFFGVFSRWTKEALYVITGNKEMRSLSKEFYRLNEKLNEIDISVKLPTYIPDGYRFDLFEEDEDFEQFHLTAWFTDGNQYFSIKVLEIDSYAISNWSEANGKEESEIYDKSGNKYVIISNNDRIQAIWKDGNYEIVLQGMLTREQLVKMIDSI